MVEELYPRELKGLDLTFEEKIYALAFELEDEIRKKGKEQVFADLSMTIEEMREAISKAIDEVEVYFLRYVLEEVATAEDAKGVEERAWEEVRFRKLVKKLKHKYHDADEWGHRWLHCATWRYALLGECELDVQHEFEQRGGICSGDAQKLADEVVDLYAQVEYFMTEVRYYDQMRDQALQKIQTLLEEIRRRKDCPQDFLENALSEQDDSTRGVDIDGAITQIRWPYRSFNLLRELRLENLNSVVEYFSNFKNFVNSNNITLREWVVIVTILRREGLWSSNTADNEVVALGDNVYDLVVIDRRTANCLARGGYLDVERIVECFACGASDGQASLRWIRGFGRTMLDSFMTLLGRFEIAMPDEQCFPTEASSVLALDFDDDVAEVWKNLRIETVGDLLAVCRSQNRFRGLRYFDENLYKIAIEALEKYGLRARRDFRTDDLWM